MRIRMVSKSFPFSIKPTPFFAKPSNGRYVASKQETAYHTDTEKILTPFFQKGKK